MSERGSLKGNQGISESDLLRAALANSQSQVAALQESFYASNREITRLEAELKAARDELRLVAANERIAELEVELSLWPLDKGDQDAQ